MHRKATQNDLQFIYNLYTHPQVNPHLLYEIMSLAEFKPIYDDLLTDGVKYIFEENNEAIGMFKLIPLKHRNSHIAYLGGVGVHPNFSGRGFGVKMLSEIVGLAKEKGFKRLELSVGTANNKAIELYKKVGFEEEGVLRNFTYLKSEGRFIDEMLMSCLFE
ncbi:MAG: GNAT family N-acetyltransferase [Bacteroidota bacterium]